MEYFTRLIVARLLYQVVLSPIQEMDPNRSGTLRNQRRTAGAAVGQGVLNPAFAAAATLNGAAVYTTQPVSLSVSPIALSTMAMSQPLLSSLGIATPSAGGAVTPPRPVLTDVTGSVAAAHHHHHHSDKDDSACGGSSSGSVSSTDERKTPASNRRKRGEVYV